MPRWFVYVNKKPKKQITVHKETDRMCGHLFKHIQKGGKYPKKTSIKILEGGAIKLGWTRYGYWLVVWAKNINGVMQHENVKNVSEKLSVEVNLCNRC